LTKTPESIRLLREEIDQIDEQIVALLNRRSDLAVKIGQEKVKFDLPVFVPSRESDVFVKVSSSSKGSFSSEALESVYREIISGCRCLEECLKVAFLGPEGTFTHQAVIKKFGRKIEFLPKRTEYEVFAAVERGFADYGVVAAENSLEGVVARVMDLFLDSPLKVCSETYIPIRHCLLSRTPIEAIKKVYSHPHALAQCRGWIMSNLPNAECHEVSSTAKGAQIAQSEEESAAIGSQVASELFDLPVVAEHISDKTENTTRFFVVGKKIAEPTGRDKTSLILFLSDRAGALADALNPFKDKKINLTRIESRPTKRAAWEYMFYLDLVGHADDERVREVFAQLRREILMLKIIGSYPMELVPAARCRPLPSLGDKTDKERW